MTKKRSRSTRRAIPRQPLDHTVEPVPSRTEMVHSTLPLMRTVPDDTGPRSVRRFRTLLDTPDVRVRASGRARKLAKVMESPFRQATFNVQTIPERAMVCARRTIRREVLFAKRGLSGSSPKRSRSKVRC